MNTNPLYVTGQLRFFCTITKLQHSCGGENEGEVSEKKLCNADYTIANLSVRQVFIN